MTNSEISKKIRDINSRKASTEQIKLHMEVQDFFSKLIEENGEVETRDIREEVLTNLVKYFVKKQKSIQVPVSHYVLDLATIQESKGKYADAKNTLELIVGENDEKYKQLVEDQKDNEKIKRILRNTNLAKAEYRYHIIKYKLGEQSFIETLNILNEICDNVDLNQEVLGVRLSAFELFKRECAEMVDFERLELDIFPQLDSLVRGGEGNGQTSDETVYTKDLLPSNRLKFIKENFKVKKIYMGKEEFTGYLLFDLEDADLIIAEKFWDENKDGSIKVATENATYILPEEESIELIKKSRLEITRLSKENHRIQKANHYSKPEDSNFSSTYYTNLKKKFNEAIGYKYFDVKSNVKKPKVAKTKYTGEKSLRPKTKSKDNSAQEAKQGEEKEEVKPKTYEEMSKDELIQTIIALQAELSEATGKLKEAIALKTDTKAFSERVITLMGEVEKVDKMIQER